MNGAALEARRERFCRCGASLGILNLYEMVALGGECDYCAFVTGAGGAHVIKAAEGRERED